MANSRWLCVLLLGCFLPLTACNSPLAARKDAGQATDVRGEDTASDLPSAISSSPDLAADAPALSDLAPADLAAREASAPDLTTLGVPKAFRFANHTDRTAYVRVDGPVGCRRPEASGWQDCSFFNLWCLVGCSNVPSDGFCCEQCEQGLPSLYAIAPGQSRSVPWNGRIYTKDKGACRECECQMEAFVQSGTFEASASVYADYQCSPMPSYPCQETSGGIIDMANPRGGFATVTVPFTVPYPGDEVVLDITSLPGMDAGIALDTGAAETDTAGDAAAAADHRPDQDSAACQPLAYTHFGPVTGPRYCPVDPALPECASSDVGATVYRDEACALATLEAHPDCTAWTRARYSEFVFLTDPFGGCGWPISLDSVLDCGDHVDIKYTVTEPCATCDGSYPSRVMLIIEEDPKPVRATAALVREKCWIRDGGGPLGAARSTGRAR